MNKLQLAKGVLLAWLIPFCLVTSASAERLTLNATAKIALDETQKQANFEFTLTNDGDELARDVGIEIPLLNQSETPAKELYPKQQTVIKLQFTFDQLKISAKGNYFLPYRVVYKDANFYPFSAPYVATLTLSPAPSRIFDIQFDEIRVGTPIKFSRESGVQLAGTVTNISSQKAALAWASAFTTSELESSFDLKYPATIEPGQKIPFHVALKNRSALDGSQYALILLLTGQVNDKSFAEESPYYQISVTSHQFNPYWIMIAIVALIALGYMFRGNSHKKVSDNTQ